MKDIAHIHLTVKITMITTLSIFRDSINVVPLTAECQTKVVLKYAQYRLVKQITLYMLIN